MPIKSNNKAFAEHFLHIKALVLDALLANRVKK